MVEDEDQMNRLIQAIMGLGTIVNPPREMSQTGEEEGKEGEESELKTNEDEDEAEAEAKKGQETSEEDHNVLKSFSFFFPLYSCYFI